MQGRSSNENEREPSGATSVYVQRGIRQSDAPLAGRKPGAGSPSPWDYCRGCGFHRQCTGELIRISLAGPFLRLCFAISFLNEATFG